MRDLMAVLKALSDENRVRVLVALKAKELCVCQITELLGLAPSTVSKHMAILKQARLVDSRKQERWIFYRRSDDAGPEVDEMTSLLDQLLVGDHKTRDDAARLKHILQLDPEKLCRKHSRC